MRITYKEKVTDPGHPIMHGGAPITKEFNKRQEKLLKEGKINEINFEQVSTVILEILCDDYNKRHASRKRKLNQSQESKND